MSIPYVGARHNNGSNYKIQLPIVKLECLQKIKNGLLPKSCQQPLEVNVLIIRVKFQTANITSGCVMQGAVNSTLLYPAPNNIQSWQWVRPKKAMWNVRPIRANRHFSSPSSNPLGTINAKQGEPVRLIGK